MRTHQMEPFSCQPYCDLGAQYLTVGQDSPIGMDYVQSIYSLLQSNSILTPLFFAPSSSGDQGEGSTKVKPIDGMKPDHLLKQHFIAPKGTASIVSFLASYHQPQKQSYSVASSTRYNTKILKLSIEGSRVRVTGGSTSAGITEPELNEELFDVVVLTVPASQLLQMDAPHLLDMKLSSEETLRQRLQQVRYSSRLNSIAFSLVCGSLTVCSLLKGMRWLRITTWGVYLPWRNCWHPFRGDQSTYLTTILSDTSPLKTTNSKVQY